MSNEQQFAQMGSSTNPKDRIGRTKPPLELIPPSALVHIAMAFKNGADKYGAYNWRKEKVSAMIYLGANLRHIADLIDREDLALDSKVHHAAHAAACCMIYLDAMECNQLVDDRPNPGKCSSVIDRFTVKAKATIDAVVAAITNRPDPMLTPPNEGPGIGYRFLDFDDVIKPLDEVWIGTRWVVRQDNGDTAFFIGHRYNANHYPTRRRLDLEAPHGLGQ